MGGLALCGALAGLHGCWPEPPVQVAGAAFPPAARHTRGCHHANRPCAPHVRHTSGCRRGLQERGMQQDLSWEHAAELYEDVLVQAKYQW